MVTLGKTITSHRKNTVKNPFKDRLAIKAAVMLTACALPFLSACTDWENPLLKIAKKDPIDQPLELSKDDYRHMAKPKNGQLEPKVEFQNHAPPVPDIAPILAAPTPPKIAGNQLVSITVTDDVPLKDVLLELAKLADVDIELDAGISGGISFIARNKPFNEVIDRIADLAGLRYSMKNGVLRIERDVPYVKTYALDFLNVDRSMTSTVNVSTNVLSSSTSGSSGGGGSSGGSSSGGSSSSSSSGGGGGGLNTGSESSVTSKTDSDFWKSLEGGVKQILTYSSPKRVSDISGLLESRDVLSAVTGGKGGDAVPAPAKTIAPVSSPPVQASPNVDAAKITENTFYTINRQAGVLTVSATEKQHEMIRHFLDKIERNASAQVLIEAKILEVQLNDTYKTGIDWTQMKSKLGARFSSSSITSTDTDVVSFIVDDKPLAPGAPNGIGELVQMTENFGTVRTLSSPRLHAINNQTATLTFAQNDVYFELKIDKQTNNGTTTTTDTTVTSTPHTIPIGIIMSLQPSINVDTNEVTLSVRPTLSSLVSTVPDPAVAYLAQTSNVNLQSNVPIVEVRELDSILKLKSGQVMVIGGLMKQNSDNTDAGMPGLSSIPVVGNFFKGVSKKNSNSELIIFIKATIVGSTGNAHPADRTIYEKFSDDPRPLTF
jgi:general secretion pathway protein D